MTAKLVDVLDVSLDYLSGKTDTLLDSATLGSIMEISVMPEDDQKQVFLVLDELIRDYKARKVYAQQITKAQSWAFVRHSFLYARPF